MKHFFVLLIVIERYDRYAIVHLESEAVCAIIDDHDVREVPTLEYSEILHVVALVRQVAVLSVEAVLNELSIRIDEIKNGIGIRLVTCRECDDLIVLVCLLEAFHYVRTNIDAGIHRFIVLVGEIDFQNDVRILRLNVIHAVYQSFIHVKDHKFLLFRIKI